MKVCIPVSEESGMESKVCEHFGSAPFFLLYELDSGSMQTNANSNQHHSHGMCQPLSALSGQGLNAVICGGMGNGAISKLNSAGIRTYLASGKTAAEVIAAFNAGQLSELTPDKACSHHDCH